MYDRQRSGQFLYFGLVSALSGNAVTGQATGISGRVSADGGTQAVIAGTISETGGGQYQANLFAADMSGNNLGFLFTASGCVPVSFTVVTQQNVSGKLYPASGVNATVPIASISGVNPASGAFVAVPPATLSGVIANSGLFVTVPPATLSGVVANSGLFVSVLKATISGVIANSGLFTVTESGTVFVASGTAVNLLSGNVTSPYSGSLSGQVVTAASGVFSTASLNSGQSVLVYSGQLSGQQVNLLSGNQTAVVSGTFTNPWSGRVFLASGEVAATLGSGQISANTFASGVIDVALPYGFLKTNMSGVTGEADRSPLNALRFLRNRWYVSGTDLHVTKENDTTDAWTSVLNTNASGQPIAGSDPT